MYIWSMEQKTKITKKNTLLYLDENLVELAKEMNFNISELAEEAIRTKININSHNKRFDPEEHLEHLRKKGLAYRIPFKVEKIRVKDRSNFKKIEIEFNKKNLLIGKNTLRKTSILRSILLFFDNNYSMKDLSTIDLIEKPLEIKVSFEEAEKIRCEVYGERIDFGKSSILIDRGLETLDLNSRATFLKYLLNRGEQIIMTSPSIGVQSSEDVINRYNVIEIGEDPNENLRKIETDLIMKRAKHESHIHMLQKKLENEENKLALAKEEDEEEVSDIENKISELNREIELFDNEIKGIEDELQSIKFKIVSDWTEGKRNGRL